MESPPLESTEPPGIESTSQPGEQSAADSIVLPSVQADYIEGRPWLSEAIPGATLMYEPWVDYQTVVLVKETYAATRDALSEELGIADFAPVGIYVTLESQFNEFAAESNFEHPSLLAGFSSFIFYQDEVIEAEVYVNAQASGIVANTAHELTHIATPGLALWLSEGVAEYIGSRVGELLDVAAQQERTLAARQVVRHAIQRGDLLERTELENFLWKAPDNINQLDLVYAQTWQLVEYVARSPARDRLPTLVAAYRQSGIEDMTVLDEVLGRSGATLWQDFSNDLLQNLTHEERVGAELCTLSQLRARSEGITRDWNAFLRLASADRPELSMEQFVQFGERWAALGADTARVSLMEETSPIRTSIVAYAQMMEQAMGRFADSDTAAANKDLVVANQAFDGLTTRLQASLAERSWLSCEG
jgi:hypothetical protein